MACQKVCSTCNPTFHTYLTSGLIRLFISFYRSRRHVASRSLIRNVCWKTSNHFSQIAERQIIKTSLSEFLSSKCKYYFTRSDLIGKLFREKYLQKKSQSQRDVGGDILELFSLKFKPISSFSNTRVAFRIRLLSRWKWGIQNVAHLFHWMKCFVDMSHESHRRQIAWTMIWN